MKKIVCLLLLIVSSITHIMAQQPYRTYGGLYYNKVSTDTVEVVFDESYSTHEDWRVIIPSEVRLRFDDDNATRRYKVVFIASGAFSNCSNIRYMKIGDNISRIKSNAFSNCYGIDSLIIGKGL